jgi:hypothetical protein
MADTPVSVWQGEMRLLGVTLFADTELAPMEIPLECS